MVYKVVRDIDGATMYRFLDKEDALIFIQTEQERAWEDIQYEREWLERTERCLEAMRNGKSYFHYSGKNGEDVLGFCPKSMTAVRDDKLLIETKIQSLKKNLHFHLVEEQ